MTSPQQQQQDLKATGLPPLEDIREQNTMRIITITTHDLPSRLVKTHLHLSDSDNNDRGQLTANLINVDNERVKSFMPSKVWVLSKNDEIATINFAVLYYINTALPQAVKPFKDNTYLMYFTLSPTDVIEYDVGIRMFMDQVPIPGSTGMVYVIMFGDEAYDSIVDEGENKQNDKSD